MRLLALAPLALLAAPAAHAQPARAYSAPNAFLASSVAVPPGYETVYLSGVLPMAEQVKGDTEAQGNAVLDRIDAQLKTLGLGFGDVVKMTVFLAADPATGRMDFAGWQKAYTKRFGTSDQPNRPTRSTVQVANLALPGALAEVEVIAVRKPAAR